MTYRDLCESLTRLETDPRVHPNTRVEVAYTHEDGLLDCPDIIHESEPLQCILLNGCITLSATRQEPAVVR